MKRWNENEVLSIRDLEISFDTVHGGNGYPGMRFDLYRGNSGNCGESGSGSLLP